MPSRCTLFWRGAVQTEIAECAHSRWNALTFRNDATLCRNMEMDCYATRLSDAASTASASCAASRSAIAFAMFGGVSGPSGAGIGKAVDQASFSADKALEMAMRIV